MHHLSNIEDGKISIFTSVKSDKNLLHFKDNGKGIPAHLLPKIFDRFVTGVGFGTGMGLAYCKMVMAGFGGDIECASIEGTGAEFILTFPKINVGVLASCSLPVSEEGRS